MTARRAYHSPTRQRQAEQSRQRILDAARARMLVDGYAASTIEQIAAEAGLAPQTVRATFGTKPRLLAAVVERAAYGVRYENLVVDAGRSTDPHEHIGVAAAITCHLYESLDAELTLLRAAASTHPELSEIEQGFSHRRHAQQAPLIEHLVHSGQLRPGLDPATAADVVWALTGHDLYRMLVRDRGWTPQAYQRWLTEQLTLSLLDSTELSVVHRAGSRPSSTRPDQRGEG